ncbi:MAG: 7-cyano-7-deazaguanine synthase [Candidatus Parcubacteria bacterium]|nr:7-cyano-7-deazaguanine synthase [Candidatus Parcubacteria bacterium]
MPKKEIKKINKIFKTVLVLFSGGRDSSSVAVEMIRAGYKVKLFTYQGGLPELVGPRGDSAPDIRHLELLKVFPKSLDAERVITGNAYLLRKLAIEKTNEMHVVYPIAIVFGIYAGAILYCLENDINDIACGYSGYQGKEDRYIEQRKDFFERMKIFLKEYGIKLHAPIIEKSKQEVMDILERCGISSNSMENKAVWGGIPFKVEKAEEYWEKCLPVIRDYIKSMRLLHK